MVLWCSQVTLYIIKQEEECREDIVVAEDVDVAGVVLPIIKEEETIIKVVEVDIKVVVEVDVVVVLQVHKHV